MTQQHEWNEREDGEIEEAIEAPVAEERVFERPSIERPVFERQVEQSVPYLRVSIKPVAKVITSH